MNLFFKIILTIFSVSFPAMILFAKLEPRKENHEDYVTRVDYAFLVSAVINFLLVLATVLYTIWFIW